MAITRCGAPGLAGLAVICALMGPAGAQPIHPGHGEVPGDAEARLSWQWVSVPRTRASWPSDLPPSHQVNVNAQGLNILGDAANEPSIAVDPTAPNRIAIGWRQFDTIASNFR